MEPILSAAFVIVSSMKGCSFGPDVLLFKRFEKNWINVDQKVYLDSNSDSYLKENLKDVKHGRMDFLKDTLKVRQPRNDYEELLELLSLIFLGGNNADNIYFHQPGASYTSWSLEKQSHLWKLAMAERIKKFKRKRREKLGLPVHWKYGCFGVN